MHKMPQTPCVFPPYTGSCIKSEKDARLNEEQHTGIHDLAVSHVLKTQTAMRHDELNEENSLCSKTRNLNRLFPLPKTVSGPN